MNNPQKITGVGVPLSALWCEKNGKGAGMSLETGEVFLDWVAEQSLSAWQLLPLHETEYEPGSLARRVPSPYKGYGVGLHPDTVDVSHVKPGKPSQKFLQQNSAWIGDYGLFCALRDYFRIDDWRQWPAEIARAQPAAKIDWERRLQPAVEAVVFRQEMAHAAFAQLRAKAQALGVKLVGDLPYYLALKSPLVWANQHLFDFTQTLELKRVSGVRRYPGSLYGRQIWGHPLYRWNEKQYGTPLTSLWKMRLTYLRQLYDVVRLDHAVGFLQYDAIHVTDETQDTRMKGAGLGVLKNVFDYSAQVGVRVFSEESGERLGHLRRALRRWNVWGVRVYRHGYTRASKTVNLQAADVLHWPKEIVGYTSTHDSLPLLTYLQSLSKKQLHTLATLAKVDYVADHRALAVRLRRAVIDSPAQMVIVPMQDWLLTEERINIPGTEKSVGDTNWSYRLPVPIEQLAVVRGVTDID